MATLQKLSPSDTAQDIIMMGYYIEVLIFPHSYGNFENHYVAFA